MITTKENAKKAALFYSQSRWGNISLNKPVEIFGIEDNNVKAYLFLIGIGHLVSAKYKLNSSLKKITREFIMNSSNNKKINQQLVIKSKEKIFQPTKFGTVIINANEECDPLIMAYNGLPFTLFVKLFSELKYNKNRSDAIDYQVNPVFRINDSMNYPDIYAEYTSFSGKKVLMNVFSGREYKKNQTSQTVQPPSTEKDSNKKIWSLIKHSNIGINSILNTEMLLFSTTSSSSVSSYIRNVPDLDWYRGCTPTASANVLAYWDIHGYPSLVDNPINDEYDLIDELADAMSTDSSGSTYDHNVDDGLGSVCNDGKYNNKYEFEIDGPDKIGVWGKIKDHINKSKPCVLLLHSHVTYHNHAVTVVGYRETSNKKYITIHDTWPETGFDVEIEYKGNWFSSDWKFIGVTPRPAKSVHIHHVNSNGTIGALEQSYRWSDGWTQAHPFIVGTQQYLFLLKEGNGNVHIHKINKNGRVGKSVFQNDWSSGWNTVEFYEIGGITYLFLLKKSDGTVHIHKMNSNGTVGNRVDTRDWSNGWTQAQPFKVGSQQYLFLLKEGNGHVHIHKFNSNGKVGTEVKQYNWSSGWSTVEFYEINGNTYLFLLKKSDGSVHVHRMNSNGTVGNRVDTRDWTSGWTTAQPFTVGSQQYLFLLKEGDGHVHIHKFKSNGKVGAEVKQYDWSSGWSTVEFYTLINKLYLIILKKEKK